MAAEIGTQRVFIVFFYVFVMRTIYKGLKFLTSWFPSVVIREPSHVKQLRETVSILKTEQLNISPQDEFARYIKLQRKIDSIMEELAKKDKERKSLIARTQRFLNIAFIVILLAFHISVVIKYRRQPVAVLPKEWFGSVGFIGRVIAFPTGIPGAIGLPCWMILCNKVVSRLLY